MKIFDEYTCESRVTFLHLHPRRGVVGSFIENLFENNFCKAKKISTFAVPKRGVLKPKECENKISGKKEGVKKG